MKDCPKFQQMVSDVHDYIKNYPRDESSVLIRRVVARHEEDMARCTSRCVAYIQGAKEILEKYYPTKDHEDMMKDQIQKIKREFDLTEKCIKNNKDIYE